MYVHIEKAKKANSIDWIKVYSIQDNVQLIVLSVLILENFHDLAFDLYWCTFFYIMVIKLMKIISLGIIVLYKYIY